MAGDLLSDEGSASDPAKFRRLLRRSIRIWFEQKAVIVTGGASGIGATTVRLFAEEGAKVVLADLSEAFQTISKEFNQRGLDTHFIQMDVTKKRWFH